MVRCLMYQYGADETDANDATQETLFILIRILFKKEDSRIQTRKAYLFAVLKYQYFRILKDRARMTGEPIDAYEDKLITGETDSYTSREAEVLLSNCIKKLTEKHQIYVNYWMDNEKASASDFSACFGVSLTNAWTIKHRLVAILEKCVEKQHETIEITPK